MNTLTMDFGVRSYPIHMGTNLLTQAGTLLANLFKGGKTAIISDENVWPLYGDILSRSLEAEGFQPFPIVLSAGENSKSFATLEAICEQLAAARLLRTQPVIALGGGVVGDVSGLAASLYCRGVPLVQIPTTLLAQVDSSVGGKVAINIAGGKNLVGAFYQPKMVIADMDTLTTLSDREFNSGMAEVIKYAAIAQNGLLPLLEAASGRQEIMNHIAGLVEICCKSKREFVLDDEFDFGNRMILNFGHTFGHAIEKLTHFSRYTHGEAVAMGMILAARYSALLNVSDGESINILLRLLEKFQLPTTTDLPLTDIIGSMAGDKKNTGKTLTLILLESMGCPLISMVEAPQLHTLGGQLYANQAQ